jgi:hypothetical protein
MTSSRDKRVQSNGKKHNPVRPLILSFHPPFCPAFVLHSELQGGGKRPTKWVRISWLAIHLGSSPHHPRSVALVLSLVTGYVSPQFHVKYDDIFETVQETKALPQSKWQQLARFVTETGEPLKEPTSTTGANSRLRSTTHSRIISQEGPLGFDFVDLKEAVDDQVPSNDANEDDTPRSLVPLGEQPTQDEQPDAERHCHPEATRRSAWLPNPTRRLIKTAYAVLDKTDAVEEYETQIPVEDPIAYAASTSDPDTLHYNKAMNTDDSAAKIKKVMLDEVNAHAENDHGEVWEKAEVPVDQDILPSVWAFYRKQRIDTREVYKCKARLNIHGGIQKHGVNYWETYSFIFGLPGHCYSNGKLTKSASSWHFRKQRLNATCS